MYVSHKEKTKFYSHATRKHYIANFWNRQERSQISISKSLVQNQVLKAKVNQQIYIIP